MEMTDDVKEKRKFVRNVENYFSFALYIFRVLRIF